MAECVCLWIVSLGCLCGDDCVGFVNKICCLPYVLEVLSIRDSVILRSLQSGGSGTSYFCFFPLSCNWPVNRCVQVTIGVVIVKTFGHCNR